MTRRIALAILLTVWATLIAGGIVAYVTTRSVMLAELDAGLLRRAESVGVSWSNEEAQNVEPGDRYMLRNETGRTLQRVPEAAPRRPEPRVVHAAFARLGDGTRQRSLTLRFDRATGGAATVVYGASAEPFFCVLDRLALALIAFGAAAGVGAAGVAVLVSRAALRPLRGTADTIGAIDEHHLDRRIDALALPLELRPVAGRLNDMLERLQREFIRHKQFFADASHELRTPVAALLTTLEVALRRPRGQEELTHTLRTCLSDARMLRQLVGTLLEHARDTASRQAVARETFDAAEVFNQCADVAEGLALERHITVRRYFPASLEISSRPQPLRGIVMNLMGNAVEYNRSGGMVELKAAVEGTDLRLSVRDSGPGVAAEHLPHLFEAFYRAAAPGRGQEDCGNPHMGLGLFLVDSNVRALGGSCRIESAPGLGTTVYVDLPDVVITERKLEETAV